MTFERASTEIGGVDADDDAMGRSAPIRTRVTRYARVMASKTTLISALAAVPLFESCSKRELGRVAKAGRVIDVADGTLIADQGQLGREAYVILDGNVAVKRANRKIAEIGAGDVVGELSLLDHGPRTASVVAMGDCSLFVLDSKEFRKVLTEHPPIAFKLLGTLAQRIRDLDRKYDG